MNKHGTKPKVHDVKAIYQNNIQYTGTGHYLSKSVSITHEVQETNETNQETRMRRGKGLTEYKIESWK